MTAVFVTGTGTDIGKTYVAQQLLRQSIGAGRPCGALKPVISGFDPTDYEGCDSAVLLGAMGRAATIEAISEISPWRYKAPLAPNMAAAAEGLSVDFAAVVDFCGAEIAGLRDRSLFIEGVGGVMSPLSDDATNLDWIQALHIPVILVAGTYLGAISHTLSAMEVLRARTIEIKGIVLSESAGDQVGLAETKAELERFLDGVRVGGIARQGAAPDLVALLGF